ncbi:hypothetical protein [Mesorhizobium salmacidum]|uniref:DNA ligase (ATP) n=1 Tax=Mesorhizobium salmacidum TaxID=3015171 RepID=A0ABU8L3U9_9HYPH
MIAPEPDGKPNFHAIHSRLAWNAELLAFVAFHILWKDGQDLRALPRIERKAILWDQARRRRHSVQRPCRGRRRRLLQGGRQEGAGGHGLKTPQRALPQRQERFLDQGEMLGRSRFRAVGIKSEAGKMTEGLLAKDGKYVGKAAVSANRSIKERLWRRVEQARSGQPPGIPNAVADDFEWLRPGMTARVRYLRGESKLRHALVQDVREKDDAGGSIEGPRDGRAYQVHDSDDVIGTFGTIVEVARCAKVWLDWGRTFIAGQIAPRLLGKLPGLRQPRPYPGPAFAKCREMVMVDRHP